MPWSTPTLLHRVSVIATTMAILTTTSLKAQEGVATTDEIVIEATAIVENEQQEKSKSSATYEVKDGKITITADEGTSPAELIQLILKEMGSREKSIVLFEARADGRKGDVLKNLPIAPGVPSAPAIEAKPRYVLGIEVAPLPEPVRSHMQLNHGLMVTTVAPEKPAAQAGIEPNDILLSVSLANDQPAMELNEMGQLAEKVSLSGEKGVPMTIQIIQSGERKTVSISPAKEDRPSFLVFMNGQSQIAPTAVNVPGVRYEPGKEQEMAQALKEHIAAQRGAIEVYGHGFQAAPAFPAMTQHSFHPQNIKSFEDRNAEIQASLEKLKDQQVELMKRLEELNKKLEDK